MIATNAVSASVHRPIRKANPGVFQSHQDVIEQFVVRNHELDIVLEVLRGNIEVSSCQHALVVAPRGRGKTMLLARVAVELRTDDELAKSLLPVRFMEESQEISDIADFWLETCFTSLGKVQIMTPDSRESCERRTPLCPAVGARRDSTSTPAPRC